MERHKPCYSLAKVLLPLRIISGNGSFVYSPSPNIGVTLSPLLSVSQTLEDTRRIFWQPVSCRNFTELVMWFMRSRPREQFLGWICIYLVHFHQFCIWDEKRFSGKHNFDLTWHKVLQIQVLSFSRLEFIVNFSRILPKYIRGPGSPTER